MPTPLLSLTDKPVQYSEFAYGSDDTQKGRSGLFATILDWDKNAKEDSFKTNFVAVAKKVFSFLDAVGIGRIVFNAGFNAELENCEYFQKGLERNKLAREKIVTALGGEASCRGIRVVQLNPNDFKDHMELGEEYFRGGEWVVQGEDPAGRKFVLLRLSNHTGQIFTATMHQRFRETQFGTPSGDLKAANLWNIPGFLNNSGDVWRMGITGSVPRFNTDLAAEFVQKVRTYQHHHYFIAPKP